MNLIEQLKHSAQNIVVQRPLYGPILDFYTRVFALQEQCLQEIQVPEAFIESVVLAIKQKNDLPLVDPSEFIIDITSATQIFADICELASIYAPGMASYTQILTKALSDDTIDPEAFFDDILHHHSKSLQDISIRLDIPVEKLLMLGHLSIAPAIRACAQQVEARMGEGPGPQKSCCPVCGNGPDLAFLDQDGRQYLHCSFCAHQWQIKRMGCVFCQNHDKDMQHYFYNEEENEYRVKVCDHCRQFIKQVDVRQMDRDFFPDLEQVATLHLDMQAREKGYYQIQI